MYTIIVVYYYELRFISRFPAFIPVTGLKCSYGKLSSSFTEISVGKTEISGTEDLEARRDLGNRASLVNRVHVKTR